jgi:integrase
MPPKKKHWISQRQLNEAVVALPGTLKGLRDRAILLVAFASGGRRRSEVADMRFEHLLETDVGYLWTIPKTKTDDKPHTVSIPRLRRSAETCPARSLGAWISAAQIVSGPVFGIVDRYDQVHFRHGSDGKLLGIRPSVVADIVKVAAQHLGLDPDEFGGHSLRSGFATDMARKKKRLEDIMHAGNWRSLSTVQGYMQTGQMLDLDNPLRQALEEEP